MLGLAVVLLVGACSPQAEPARTDKPSDVKTTNTPDNKTPDDKEADVSTPAADSVAATYDLKIEGMT